MSGVLIASPAIGGADIGVWDTKCNQFQKRFEPFNSIDSLRSTQAGMCTALSALGSCHILGAYEDGSIRLWDIRHTYPLSTTKLHAEPIFALGSAELPSRSCQAAGRQYVCVSGGADGCVVHSQIAPASAGEGVEDPGRPAPAAITETCRTALGGSGAKGVNSVSVRDDGRIAAAACWDGRVRVYASRRPRLLASLRCHTRAVLSVAFAPAGRWLASASEDTRIALWAVYREGSEPPAAAAAAAAEGRHGPAEDRG